MRRILKMGVWAVYEIRKVTTLGGQLAAVELRRERKNERLTKKATSQPS